jgi:hypothetical protein
MIAVDSANDTDIILISTPTNSVYPINWITKAISWSKTPELLWSGTFYQGPSQNSFTYNIIENVVQKIDIMVSTEYFYCDEDHFLPFIIAHVLGR